MSPSTWLYQSILFAAQPLVRLRLRRRARKEPEYGERVEERFGQVPSTVRSQPIWFHTVSAGETIAAAPLIKELVAEFGDTPFLVTTMTPTGSEQVTQRMGGIVDHCYAPYDFKPAIKRFFTQVQPRLLVLMETELWPNMIAEAESRGIAVLIVNARLSERSAKGYQRLGSLTRRMLSRLDHVACQTSAHRDRFIALGARAQNVTVTGSVKYDMSLPDDFDEQIERLKERFAFTTEPVWIAASTHPGEDEIVLAAHAKVREHITGLRLVLIPRHPVRADEVVELVSGYGWSSARQSVPSSSDSEAEILVGDVMGSLQVLYGLGRVAFVGGSLVDIGGHNPIEPALCRMPILCGPFQFNFADIMQSLSAAGGMCTITGADEMAQALENWLTNSEARAQAGAVAFQTIEKNRGAKARIYELIRTRITTALA